MRREASGRAVTVTDDARRFARAWACV